MAKSNPSVETFADLQNKTFVEALNHAKNTSEDVLAKDFNVNAGSSKCVHSGYPADLHEAFKSELHKIKLLKKVLADKDKLINEQSTYTQELKHQLSEEQRQTRIMRDRYENERTHSHYLSQTISKAHEVALSLQNQAARSEMAEVASRGELHQRTVSIKKLEEQSRQLVAVLTQGTFRVNESGQGTSQQVLERCVEDVSSLSPDIHEEPTTQVFQENSTLQNTSAAMSATTKPLRSILKRSSTNDPALTTLITSAMTWVRSRVQPTNTREVYFHKDECYPKPSSPGFRERVRLQLCLEQMALARHYLVSLEVPDGSEKSEHDDQSSTFELKKREQMKEEQHTLAQSSMQRLGMVRMEQQD